MRFGIFKEIEHLEGENLYEGVRKHFNYERPNTKHKDYQSLKFLSKKKGITQKELLDNSFGKEYKENEETLKKKFLKLVKEGKYGSKEYIRVMNSYYRITKRSIFKELGIKKPNDPEYDFEGMGKKEVKEVIESLGIKNRKELFTKNSLMNGLMKRFGNLTEINEYVFGKLRRYEEGTEEFFVQEVQKYFEKRGIYNVLDCDEEMNELKRRMNKSGFFNKEILKKAGIESEMNVYEIISENKSEAKRIIKEEIKRKFNKRIETIQTEYYYYFQICKKSGISFPEIQNELFGKVLHKINLNEEQQKEFKKEIVKKYEGKEVKVKMLTDYERRVIRKYFGDAIKNVFGEKKYKHGDFTIDGFELMNKEEILEKVGEYMKINGIDNHLKSRKAGIESFLKKNGLKTKDALSKAFGKEINKGGKYVGIIDESLSKDERIEEFKKYLKNKYGEKRPLIREMKFDKYLGNHLKITETEFTVIVNEVFQKRTQKEINESRKMKFGERINCLDKPKNERIKIISEVYIKKMGKEKKYTHKELSQSGLKSYCVYHGITIGNVLGYVHKGKLPS